MLTQLSYSDLLLYFFWYAALGWLCETIWCTIGQRKLVNRGFLSGPWCPIYGFGAIFILLFTEPAKKYPVLVLLIAMVVASLLEYFTGWLLEALFQTRWWDYSSRKFNLKGRICLRNSVMFGLLGLALTYLLHPAFTSLVSAVPSAYRRLLASLLFLLFGIDFVRSLVSVTGLNERLAKVQKVYAEMERLQKEYDWYDKKDVTGSLAQLKELCQQLDVSAQSDEILKAIEDIQARKGSGFRMLDAFPDMKAKTYNEELAALQEEWRRQRAQRKAERTHLWNKLVAKVKADFKEAYKGITFSRIVWVFLIGCVLGYVVETLYCLLTRGVLESRQGMIYGPFNQVYGFGAIVLTLTLAPLAHHNNLGMFLGGAVIGGLFEALCSYIQEMFFGSVSWNYEGQAFSFFGGRTSLLFMFFWGVLSVVYMRLVYPRIIDLITHLEKRPKRFVTGAIVLALSADMLISGLAVARWSERQQGISASNSIEVFLDEHYPNAMLEEIYPNLVHVTDSTESTDTQQE